MARKISFLFCAFLRFRSRLISSIVSNLTVGIIKLNRDGDEAVKLVPEVENVHRSEYIH